MLWVVFIAFLLLAGIYRDWRLLFVLLPALVIQAVWFGVVKLSGMSVREAPMFSQIFVPFYMALAIFVAMVYRIKPRRKLHIFILAIIIMAFGALLSFLAYNFVGRLDIPGDSRMMLIFYTILGGAFLLALAITGFLFRRRLTRLRLAPCLLVGSFVFVMLFTFIFGLIDLWPIDKGDIEEILAVGAILGLAACGFILPFMILSFCGAFHKCFFAARVPPPPATQQRQNKENPSTL